MGDQHQCHQQQHQQHQQPSSLLSCSLWPHKHIHTDAEAPVSFPEFCRVFGFPVGPSGSGSGSLLLFYELLDQSGALVQRGRASQCPQLGQHPEAMLFAPDGYLPSVLDVCDSVSSVRLYSSHSPCEDPGIQCCSLLQSFLEQRPWVRLDLLFSQLLHTQPCWPQALRTREALRSLASLWPRVTLTPLSGRAWALLLGNFVADVPLSLLQAQLLPGRVAADRLNAVELSAITGIGPAYLDLPSLCTREDAFTNPNHVSAGPITILPPPHLPIIEDPNPGTARHPAPRRPTPHRGAATQPIRPINVVRHVRMLRPLVSQSNLTGSHPPLPSLLLTGRPVKVVMLREREVDDSGSSVHTHTHTHTQEKYK